MTTILLTKRKYNPIEILKCLERYVVNMMMMIMVSLFSFNKFKFELKKKKKTPTSCIALSKINEKSLIKNNNNRFYV